MANEITLKASLKFEKDSTNETLDAGTVQITVSGSQMLKHRQSVGTSEEAITLGDISAGGYVMAINRDSTNFVKIRSGTGATDLIRLKAGEVALFRLDTGATAPFAIADTAACEVEFFLIEA